jgi:uncharacterized protein YigE (DUF2233 family)
MAVCGAAAVVWSWRFAPPAFRTETPTPAPCRDLSFEGQDYVVCEIPLDRYAVSIAHNDGTAKPLSTVGDLVAARARRPVLAMNGGMYDLKLAPVGLLIEDGRTLKPLNLRDGPGNFHLKPNGVFYVDRNGDAGVVDSGRWASRAATARFATQSGPMLVVDGRLHPAFEPNGASRYRRNGVGVRGDTVVLAVSRGTVSFGTFARLFRDALGCPNALFLDGAVSALEGPAGPIVGGTFPAGPVIVVDRKPS